jgi:hypothetical protein
MSFSNPYESTKGNSKSVSVLFNLLISIIVIIFSFIFLVIENRKLDANINQCIMDNTELISASNALILATGNAQRAILSFASVDEINEEKYIKRQWVEYIVQIERITKSIYQKIESNSIYLKRPISLKNALTERNKYVKYSEEFYRLWKNNSKEASFLLVTKLNPQFKKYRGNQLKTHEYFTHHFLEKSSAITKKASVIVWVIFAIGVSPFFFLGYSLYKGKIL